MQASHPQADPESLRRAMRHWVAGVTIVTSTYEGITHGMTVSSFTSISLVPPMILVSLERGSRTHALVTASGTFAVTILGTDQKEISERFAGRQDHDANRFDDLEVATLISGAPLIKGGLAWFDCRVTAVQEAGTSTVFLAEVMAARSTDGDNPLVYSNRTYFSLQN